MNACLAMADIQMDSCSLEFSAPITNSLQLRGQGLLLPRFPSRLPEEQARKKISYRMPLTVVPISHTQHCSLE